MDKRLRAYTMQNLKKGFFYHFFRKLSITNWIIILNVLIYVVVMILLAIFPEEKIISIIALQGDGFFQGKIWTLLTSMFVHLQIWHLAANMFSLFFIGNFVEKLIGRKRFFWLYILSGLIAGLFFVFLSHFLGGSFLGAKLFGSNEIYAVGASGAIFSLLGLLAVLTPYSQVYLIAGPLIAIILEAVLSAIFPGSSLLKVLDLLIYVYLFLSIFLMFSLNPRALKIALPIKMSFWLLPIVAIVPLVVISLFVSLPIGNSAHFGGLIVGLAYAFYLRKKYKKKTELIKKYFSG